MSLGLGRHFADSDQIRNLRQRLAAKQFAAVSDLGGKAEVLATCSVYGGRSAFIPVHAGENGYQFGVDYPDTLKDFGQPTNTSKRLCAADRLALVPLLRHAPEINRALRDP